MEERGEREEDNRRREGNKGKEITVRKKEKKE
jgi:hypothetical protein